MTRLILLPGMDGTGDLFRPFVEALPVGIEVEVIRYPRRDKLSYPDLFRLIMQRVDQSQPYFLLAESFSTPLAFQIAASEPPNLRGVIICAGFAWSPIQGWKRRLVKALSPVLFRLPLPEFAIRRWLADTKASNQLIVDIRSAIASVSPDVLAHRLLCILSVDVRQIVSRTSSPILWVRAIQDRLVKDDSDTVLGASCKKEIVAIDAPHLLLQSSPAELAAYVGRFVDRYRSGRG